MKYIEKILEDIENGKQLKVNIRPFCRYLYNYRYGCDCQVNNKQCKHCILDDTLNVIRALNQDVPDKFILTQFEYDLLINCKGATDYNENDIIKNYWIIEGMKQKGYFKNIELSMNFKEVLENCEVVENVG